MRCLEKNRDDRFSSVTELMTALRTSLANRIDDATVARSMIIQPLPASNSGIAKTRNQYDSIESVNRDQYRYQTDQTEAVPKTREITSTNDYLIKSELN